MPRYLYQYVPHKSILASRLAINTSGVSNSGEEVQIADIILDCGDSTVLIETKASLIREDKIDSFAPDDYVEFLRLKYGVSLEKKGARKKKGIAQLATTVANLASKDWKLADASFPVRARIVPVLLVHDSLIDAALHPWFLAREFAALVDPTNVDLHAEVMQVGGHLVANLVVITIDDLEALESSVQTFGFGQLLSDYAANCKDRLISLHNYIVGESKYGNALVYSDRLRTTFRNELKQSGDRIGFTG